jgi:hypothetical protein
MDVTKTQLPVPAVIGRIEPMTNGNMLLIGLSADLDEAIFEWEVEKHLTVVCRSLSGSKGDSMQNATFESKVPNSIKPGVLSVRVKSPGADYLEVSLTCREADAPQRARRPSRETAGT